MAESAMLSPNAASTPHLGRELLAMGSGSRVPHLCGFQGCGFSVPAIRFSRRQIDFEWVGSSAMMAQQIVLRSGLRVEVKPTPFTKIVKSPASIPDVDQFA
jgi:hypothetical protein